MAGWLAGWLVSARGLNVGMGMGDGNWGTGTVYCVRFAFPSGLTLDDSTHSFFYSSRSNPTNFDSRFFLAANATIYYERIRTGSTGSLPYYVSW
jgi:hypothetical protein